MPKIHRIIWLVGLVSLSTAHTAVAESSKQDLIAQLRNIEDRAPSDELGKAAEFLRRTVSPSKGIKVHSSDAKMKTALETLKTSAVATGPRYSNKTFICKQDYDKCEPKAKSWLSGPWSCEVAFATCLSECLVAAGKK